VVPVAIGIDAEGGRRDLGVRGHSAPLFLFLEFSSPLAGRHPASGGHGVRSEGTVVETVAVSSPTKSVI
jgi:hypothetical protein